MKRGDALNVFPLSFKYRQLYMGDVGNWIDI